MIAFEVEARSKFLDEMVKILRASSDTPRQNVLDATVRQEIETLAKQAESFGLQSLESIGIFLQVANDIGWDFYQVSTAAREVLGSRELDEDTKRAWLEKWHRGIMS